MIYKKGKRKLSNKHMIKKERELTTLKGRHMMHNKNKTVQLT